MTSSPTVTPTQPGLLLLDDVPDEHGDILAPHPQRRHFNGENGQTVVVIWTERALVHGRQQVSVGGCVNRDLDNEEPSHHADDGMAFLVRGLELWKDIRMCDCRERGDDLNPSRRVLLKTDALTGAAFAASATFGQMQSAAEDKAAPASGKLKITIAGYQCDRIKGLMDGSVQVEGCKTQFQVARIGPPIADGMDRMAKAGMAHLVGRILALALRT